MRQFGTDALAMAVIVGGAAVGGASTFLFSETPSDARFECSATAEAQPRVVVSLGGEDGSFVVASNVESNDPDACETRVHVREIRIDRAHEAGERARVSVERVRERAERARERAEQSRERVERTRERVERIGRVERVHIQSLEDMDFDFDFDFDFETRRWMTRSFSGRSSAASRKPLGSSRTVLVGVTKRSAADRISLTIRKRRARTV